MARLLPPQPSVETLKKQAKSLLAEHKAGDASCCETLHLHSRFADASDPDILSAKVSLQQVQHALALDYGFEGWTALRAHAERRDRARGSLTYWERGFGDTPEQKVERVCDDPEWSALIDEEARLAPLSDEAKAIRGCIARMEPCHESFGENVRRALKMIGSMMPRDVLDCGEVGRGRARQAAAFAAALTRWRDEGADAPGDAKEDQEVGTLLGLPDDRKKGLVTHLIRKLEDNAYHAYPWDEEDFDKTEARVTHLEVCAHYWEQSLHVLLAEIGAGRRTQEWHSSDGFNACGDCPDHAAEQSKILEALDAWLAGESAVGRETAELLGEKTPEKAWLAASLAKHIRSTSDTGRIISGRP